MNEIIVYLLKVIAIHGLLYVFYRLVFRNTGHHTFNRLYLLIALIIAFFIPFIELTVPDKIQPIEEVPAIMWLSEPVSMEEFELVPVAKETTSSYWYLVPWFYGLTVIGLLARSIFYVVLLTRLQKTSEYINKRWFKLFKISQDRPFSFFSNVFMPKTLFGSESFEQILAHECEHVKQRHSLDRLLVDFVVSLFWFNPFIYLYRNALIEIHEFQADEVVLNRFKDPVGYQEILFSQLQTAQYSGLVSHFNFSMIKKRIVMMNKQRKMSGWVYALTAPVTLIVIFAFSSKETMEPINDMGNEIASILGPENGFDWPEFDLKEVRNSDERTIQDGIPSISPVKDSDLVRMSSGFGMRMHPVKKVKKMHYGMDFACPMGTEILATADGKVSKISSTPNQGYGNLLVLSHEHGYLTKYAQLSEFKVKEGDEVKKGDVIALSGNSGMSTAPHLHYEVVKNGKQVNPVAFIKDYNFKSQSTPSQKKQSELEKEEQQMALAQQERELAEKQQMLAMKEKELAQHEMELAQNAAKEAAQQQSLAEERRQMELKIMNEKLKFEDSKQNPTLRISNLGKDPLIVIDGIIVYDVSDLDPEDIESIEVLKGVSAKSKYGSKGKNGVIEIKSKNKNKQKNKDKGKLKSKDKQKDKQQKKDNKKSDFR